jgi:hypothetical protein
MSVNKVFLPSILIFSCLFFLPDNIHSQYRDQLHEGDLLFQDLNCGDLCDAIETVTQGINGRDFSHCAMVVKMGDSLKVIEAIGSQVQVNTIQDFFARSGDTDTIRNIVIARVHPSYDPILKRAIMYAKEQIGQPYDDEFLLNNGKWYCSELLYESFKSGNNQKEFFVLEPMTFKDPTTKSYFPAWIDYYKKLNAEIPEGKYGINPGLISRSDKLKIIKI